MANSQFSSNLNSNAYSDSSPWTEDALSLSCFCGASAIMRTAWRGQHPGRRFYSCVTQSCKFFRWHDPPMCERSKLIIPGLLKKINNLEEEVAKIEKKVWRQAYVAGLKVLVILVVANCILFAALFKLMK